jgi:hypothetical protein
MQCNACVRVEGGRFIIPSTSSIWKFHAGALVLLLHLGVSGGREGDAGDDDGARAVVREVHALRNLDR